MCLGTLMATTAFWAYQLGFGVDLSTWGGERSGYARLGGVRADAVMIWPPLLMGCFGTLGLTLSAMVSGRFPSRSRRLKTLTVAAFFASMPPLVATMTHGAYAGFALMAFVVISMIYTNLKRRASRSSPAPCRWRRSVVSHGGGDHPDVCLTIFSRRGAALTRSIDYYQRTSR
jgi:hypothetical protein